MSSLGWTHINMDYIWPALTFVNFSQYIYKYFQEFVYSANISVIYTIIPVYMIMFYLNFSIFNLSTISPVFGTLLFYLFFYLFVCVWGGFPLLISRNKTYWTYYTSQAWYSRKVEISQNWRVRHCSQVSWGQKKD